MPRARNGPSPSSSSCSATSACVPPTPRPAAGRSWPCSRRYTATRSIASSSEIRSIAVSSVCASDSCAIAWPTTASSARVRSSSRPACARLAARPQRVRRAHREARQRAQLVLGGPGRGRVEELERAEGRRPELERDGAGGACGKALAVLDRERLPGRERLLDEVARLVEPLVLAGDALGGHEREPLRAHEPEDGGGRPRRTGRDADDLLRRAVDVRAGGECLAGELERDRAIVEGRPPGPGRATAPRPRAARRRAVPRHAR